MNAPATNSRHRTKNFKRSIGIWRAGFAGLADALSAVADALMRPGILNRL
jgi:hypothetical protein